MIVSGLEELDSDSTINAAHHNKKHYAQPAAQFQTHWDKKNSWLLEKYNKFPICGHTQLAVQSSFLYRYIIFKMTTAQG